MVVLFVEKQGLNMDKNINENTAAIHRASVSKAFNAKPAKPAEKKPSQIERDMEELQAALGKDVVVKPQMKAKGGKVKKYAEGGDVFSKAEPYLKKAVEKMDKSLGVTKETSPELKKSFAEKLEKLSKSSGGGGGGMGTGKMNRDITKAYKAGGSVSSASKRADGCAVKGKTKGKMV
jgi:hypothetical protein